MIGLKRYNIHISKKRCFIKNSSDHSMTIFLIFLMTFILMFFLGMTEFKNPIHIAFVVRVYVFCVISMCLGALSILFRSDYVKKNMIKYANITSIIVFACISIYEILKITGQIK